MSTGSSHLPSGLLSHIFCHGLPVSVFGPSQHRNRMRHLPYEHSCLLPFHLFRKQTKVVAVDFRYVTSILVLIWKSKLLSFLPWLFNSNQSDKPPLPHFTLKRKESDAVIDISVFFFLRFFQQNFADPPHGCPSWEVTPPYPLENTFAPAPVIRFEWI